MDHLLNTFVSFLVFGAVYGIFLFIGVKVARIEGAIYGFCALLALAGSLGMLGTYLLVSSLGLAGQVATSVVGLVIVFYLLLRTFRCRPGQAALAILVSIAIPTIISLLLRLFTAAPPA